MLVPATGSIYWSEGYPGQLLTLLSKSDLSQFVVNEEILLTFLAASKVDTPLQCRTIGQKLASSCSQARTKLVNIYSGNERTIVLFVLFESALLVVLIGLVKFCYTFWAKRKLKDQGLGSFLDKRLSLKCFGFSSASLFPYCSYIFTSPPSKSVPSFIIHLFLPFGPFSALFSSKRKL